MLWGMSDKPITDKPKPSSGVWVGAIFLGLIWYFTHHY